MTGTKEEELDKIAVAQGLTERSIDEGRTLKKGDDSVIRAREAFSREKAKLHKNNMFLLHHSLAKSGVVNHSYLEKALSSILERASIFEFQNAHPNFCLSLKQISDLMQEFEGFRDLFKTKLDSSNAKENREVYTLCEKYFQRCASEIIDQSEFQPIVFQLLKSCLKSLAQGNEIVGAREHHFETALTSSVPDSLLARMRSKKRMLSAEAITAEIKQILDIKVEKTDTYENNPQPDEAGMEDDKGDIDDPLSALAKSISTDTNVQAEFERQARMLISKAQFLENEANPPPIPERKYHPRKDNIVEFLQEVWGEWNDRDLLSRRVLQIHDRRAHGALINYLRTDTLPEGLNVWTTKDETDRWLEHGLFTADEVTRASGALQTRRHS